ncbi:MAG: hypothetical protein J6D06_07140 [Clostridia bacterium]|nr:hypothetical protein [Clostridia bacterium]
MEKEINEISCNENEDINKTKKRLKKWQKALIILGSVVLAFFSAVIIRAAIDVFSVGKEPKKHEIRVEDKELEISKEYSDPAVEGEIKTTPIKLSAEGERAFEDYLKTVVPKYEYSDLYAIEESLALYNKKNSMLKILLSFTIGRVIPQ